MFLYQEKFRMLICVRVSNFEEEKSEFGNVYAASFF